MHLGFWALGSPVHGAVVIESLSCSNEVSCCGLGWLFLRDMKVVLEDGRLLVWKVSPCSVYAMLWQLAALAVWIQSVVRWAKAGAEWVGKWVGAV